MFAGISSNHMDAGKRGDPASVESSQVWLRVRVVVRQSTGVGSCHPAQPSAAPLGGQPQQNKQSQGGLPA